MDVGLRSYPARLSYCKINNLETETRMNNFTITTFDDFQDMPIEDEPVSIEFGMDPVIKKYRSLIDQFHISKCILCFVFYS